MSHPVQLYIYDLSNGMARMLSRQLTGTHFDAIYHSASSRRAPLPGPR